MSDARGCRGTRVPISPARRILTRRRHIVAWREDEHRDAVSTPTQAAPPLTIQRLERPSRGEENYSKILLSNPVFQKLDVSAAGSSSNPVCFRIQQWRAFHSLLDLAHAHMHTRFQGRSARPCLVSLTRHMRERERESQQRWRKRHRLTSIQVQGMYRAISAKQREKKDEIKA